MIKEMTIIENKKNKSLLMWQLREERGKDKKANRKKLSWEFRDNKVEVIGKGQLMMKGIDKEKRVMIGMIDR